MTTLHTKATQTYTLPRYESRSAQAGGVGFDANVCDACEKTRVFVSCCDEVSSQVHGAAAKVCTRVCCLQAHYQLDNTTEVWRQCVQYHMLHKLINIHTLHMECPAGR